MKVRSKLLFGFISVALFSVVIGITGSLSSRSVESSYQRVVTETLIVLEALHEISSGSLRVIASTSEFGFITAEKAHMLAQQSGEDREDYERAATQAEEEEEELAEEGVEVLSAAVIEYSNLQNEFQHLDLKADQVVKFSHSVIELSDKIIALKTSGVSGEEVLELKEEFEDAERALLRFIEGIHDELIAQLDVQTEQVSTDLNEGQLWIASFSFASFFFAIAIGLYLAQHISSPLGKLKAATKKVRDGELEVDTQITSADEIGDLAESFGFMVSGLKEAAELSVAKHYVDNILASMTDTLIVLNEDLTIRSCNQAAMSLLDYDEQALSGKHFSKVLQIDDVERVFEFVEKEGHFVEDQGVCYLSKSGASIPVIFSASTLEDKRKGYVCIAHDIGDLIRAQRELQETNTKLRKMNLEVKEVQAQLVQSAKLASVGELATGVAHELNQPLNIMSLNANLVLNDCKGQRYNEVEGFCNLVMDQVRRANEIINHLRTFGREADLIHKQLTPIEKIVHDSFIMLREQLKLANINVEKKIEENLPSVYCNPIQIEQVLTNLIVNARDALEGSNNKQIKVSAECDGDNLVISVADNGSGIPEDILGRIFDPFMTTKEVGKGTGLGLSISHGLIKDHKGKIEVESTFERGTTFKIYLPIESDVDQSE